MSSTPITEKSLNFIAEGTELEGKVSFTHLSRVHGSLKGEITGTEGSVLILAENGWIEGTIHADTLIIDGFVRGEIHARTKVTVSGTGRVVGNIHSPNVEIQYGAYFEGNCQMEGLKR